MRRVPLRAAPPADHSHEPGWREWHSPTFGPCTVCHRPGRLIRHHVVAEQVVRREGGDPWDLANSLELGMYCRCHRAHHSGAERLPASSIPILAIEFAIQLLGIHAADLYIDRFYAPR